jgi:hypothetical protein
MRDFTPRREAETKDRQALPATILGALWFSLRASSVILFLKLSHYQRSKKEKDKRQK